MKKTVACVPICVFFVATAIFADGDLFMRKGCAVCHGNNAQGNKTLAAPAIAGLEESYVVRQLQNFKAGNRGYHQKDYRAKVMIGSAQVLSENDIGKLAEYLASLAPIKHKPTVSGNPLNGKDPYLTCQSCHGDKAQGNKDLMAPPLAGLQDWYIVSQLSKFRTGIRGTDAEKEPVALSMAPMAQLLADDKAVRDMALYILSLNNDEDE